MHRYFILPAAGDADTGVAGTGVAGTSLCYILEGESSSSRPRGASLSQDVETSAIAKPVKAAIPSTSQSVSKPREVGEKSGQKLLLKIVTTLHAFPVALQPIPCAAFLARAFPLVPSIHALLSAVCYQIMREN